MSIRIAAVSCLLLLAACGTPVPRDPVKGHLNAETASAGVPAASSSTIPKPVWHTLAIAPSASSAPVETYSVVVQDVPVRDLLFALARDAKLNVDIHAGLSGRVTLNAIEQTLPQLLSRIARQVDMRFEMDGVNLIVLPDTPFLRHYMIDYVNMSRTVASEVATNTQIASGTGYTASGGTEALAASPLGNGNISSTRVENLSRNMFWESLEQNIRDILLETAQAFSGEETMTGAAAEEMTPPRTRAERQSAATPRLPAPRPNPREASPAVILNPESGVLAVRATGRQHERVQAFIDQVTSAARRQVMIEATIVEVELGEDYQQGIEWNRVWANGDKTFSFSPASPTSVLPPAMTPFVLRYAQDTPLSVTLNLLQSFGATRVLSSPRLAVLNNQTALLKVVENVVYFNIRADVTAGNSNSNPLVAYTSTPQTVSVGLVMSVTPQISEGDQVILNVRPSISSIVGMVKDPNPDIPANVANEIPQIRTREIESVLRLSSGEIAVLGGLMEDRADYRNGRVPLLGQIPLVGELLSSRNDAARKSELVIFLRPVVIHEPGLNGDFARLKAWLPDAGFFAAPAPGPMNWRNK
ncbi:MAG: type II and III secretion system protein [Zoogloeaceae bacterium]|jgi:general secretion pathway protein D|nr:type II and III secretion system protein [Zoogloeaceae bacterium]